MSVLHVVCFCLLSAVICKETTEKLASESVFLRTETSAEEMYFISFLENDSRRECLWILLAAVYGFVSASASVYVHCNNALEFLGFKHMPLVPRLD